jgi:hypothetical protein
MHVKGFGSKHLAPEPHLARGLLLLLLTGPSSLAQSQAAGKVLGVPGCLMTRLRGINWEYQVDQLYPMRQAGGDHMVWLFLVPDLMGLFYFFLLHDGHETSCVCPLKSPGVQQLRNALVEW